MDRSINRRRFLQGAAAAGITGAALGLGRSGAGAAWESDPNFKVKVSDVKDKPQNGRPLIFGAGMIWAAWLERPKSYDLAQMDKLKDLGATLTSATFDWVDREKKPGEWDWSYPDHAVEAAQKRGLKQFGYIGNTPGWALPEGVDPSHGYRHPPADKHRAAFENYCRTAAKRYKGKVDLFQFWNEPNGCSWIRDGCSNGDQFEEYTKWLKIAYAALKEGNPDCTVCAAALDYNEGVKEGYKYIEGMYRCGARGHFDAISIHPYHPDGLFWQAVDDTYRVMKENGDADKGVWITEYGWNDSKGEGPAEKLRQVVSKLCSKQYSFVTLANYLCVTDLPIKDTEQYGLCDRELNERPVAKAFRELAQAAKKRGYASL